MNAERCIAMFFNWKAHSFKNGWSVSSEHFKQTSLKHQEAIDSSTVSVDATETFFSYQGLFKVHLNVFYLLFRKSLTEVIVDINILIQGFCWVLVLVFDHASLNFGAHISQILSVTIDSSLFKFLGEVLLKTHRFSILWLNLLTIRRCVNQATLFLHLEVIVDDPLISMRNYCFRDVLSSIY